MILFRPTHKKYSAANRHGRSSNLPCSQSKIIFKRKTGLPVETEYEKLHQAIDRRSTKPVSLAKLNLPPIIED